MDASKLTTLAIAAGMLFAAYRFGPTHVKAMVLGVAGIIAAKQIPYLNQVI